MEIFSQASNISLPNDPKSLVEGKVTDSVSSGIKYGSDPAKKVTTTINNVGKIDTSVASTLGPNFDRFSVLRSPSSYKVTGNLISSGQDLIPISTITNTFGNNFITDELKDLNTKNLITNPKDELTKLAKNIGNSVENEAKQAGKAAVRSVIQDVKDITRGAVNTILNPNAAKTQNLGVTDSRLSYSFRGPLDAHRAYSKGRVKGSDPEFMKGVEPIMNPHYVFRYHNVASKGAGTDSELQSKLLLDKEFREGISTEGVREVTLSNILSKFGNFSKTNQTPYRASDFLWLKYYNRIPLNRLVTLRRYMFPIDDNRYRSPYFKKSEALFGWANNPVSQMVTYFGGESGNNLSSLLKINPSTTWNDSNSDLSNYNLFNGLPTDAIKLFNTLATSTAGGTIASTAASQAFSNIINSKTSAAVTSQTAADVAKIGLTLSGIVDPERASGLTSFRDTFNPYASGGYFSNLYQEPYNVIRTTKKRTPGLNGGVGDNISLIFEYSLKAIGHINAKAAMLDIMSNILATTHYRGNFWGGEARFFMNKGIFPLLDEKETLKLVKNLWTGDYAQATKTFEEIIKKSFGENATIEGILNVALASKTANQKEPKSNSGEQITPGGGTGILTGQDAASSTSSLMGKFTGYTALQVLSGLFGLTDAGANPAIPAFQALKTGAPVGEWHLTIGNPFKPIAKIGNLVCSGVTIEFNDELGSDDFPTEMKAIVSLQPGMPRANQDIESVFNFGGGSLYIPKPGPTKHLDEILETVSRETAISQTNDFMGLLPTSLSDAFGSMNTNIMNNSYIVSAHIGGTQEPNTGVDMNKFVGPVKP